LNGIYHVTKPVLQTGAVTQIEVTRTSKKSKSTERNIIEPVYKGIAVDPSTGNLLVTDNKTGQVREISIKGRSKEKISERQELR
jgi:hypothetical protein